MWVLRLNFSYCKITQEEEWDPAFACTCCSRERLEELFSTGVYSYSMPQQNGCSARVSAVSTKEINLKCWRRPQLFLCWGENTSEGEHLVAVLESCWYTALGSTPDVFVSILSGQQIGEIPWQDEQFSYFSENFPFFAPIFRLFWFRLLTVIIISCKMNIVTFLAIDRQVTEQNL